MKTIFIIIIIFFVYILTIGEFKASWTNSGKTTFVEYNGIVWVILYHISTNIEKPFIKVTKTYLK